MPFGIQLESVRNSLRKMPTLDELLIPQMGALNLVLAPFAPILAVAALLVALINAVKAVPDAISSFDPSIITDALNAVVEKAAPLAQFIPGMPYVIMIRDILNVVRALIVEVQSIVIEFNAALTRIEASVAALSGMNPEAAGLLRDYLSCTLYDLQARQLNLAQSLSLLRTIICAMTIPLQMLEAFLPAPARDSVRQARCQFRYLFEVPSFSQGALLEDTIAETHVALRSIETALSEARRLLEMLDGIFSRLIGETPGSNPSAIECFADCD